MLFREINSIFITKPTRCTNYSNLFLNKTLHVSGTVSLSIIRNFSLYTQQYTQFFWQQAVSKPLWHTPLLCVQWKTPDDGQRKCPQHVEFYSKNKFEKLVHLVGFTIRIWFLDSHEICKAYFLFFKIPM